MDFIGDLNCVAVWLAEDIQQHGRLPVRGDDRIHGLNGLLTAATSLMRIGAPECVVLATIGDLGRGSRLAVHQRELQSMIVLEKPGRIDQVTLEKASSRFGTVTCDCEHFSGSG